MQSYLKKRRIPQKFRPGICGNHGGTSLILRIFQIVFVLFGSIWLLAIAKVFILEKHRINSSGKMLTNSFVGDLKVRSYSGHNAKDANEVLIGDVKDIPKANKWDIIHASKIDNNEFKIDKVRHPVLVKAMEQHLPKLLLGSEIKEDSMGSFRNDNGQLIPADQLKWPPVGADQITIPANEG